MKENNRMFQEKLERNSQDSTAAQGSRSVAYPESRLLNRPSYQNQQSSFKPKITLEEYKSANLGKGGYGIGGGVVGSTHLGYSNPDSGRSYSPHKRAFEDSSILDRESSPERRVRFLKEKVNEMRYTDYQAKVGMLNKVKDYFRVNWKDMSAKKKRRIIGMIKRMEAEVDVIEHEVT